jgi:hypothetical protein
VNRGGRVRLLTGDYRGVSEPDALARLTNSALGTRHSALGARHERYRARRSPPLGSPEGRRDPDLSSAKPWSRLASPGPADRCRRTPARLFRSS